MLGKARGCSIRFALALVTATWLCTAGVGTARAKDAPMGACRSTVTGDLRLHPLKSAIFGNTRTIRVLLPPGYDAPANRQRSYPTLYLLDGQNLFDDCLSTVSHHEWGVDETVYRLIGEKAIPPIIVIGIDNAGRNRAREYLPYKDYVGNSEMAEPMGAKFPDFLTREVMPWAMAHYRVLAGHENTGIGGSSYGGVAALYALLAKPAVFGYGLVESPTLWIGMGQLVRDTSPLVARPNKVFVGFGLREIDNPAGAAVMQSLLQTLQTNFKTAGYDDSSLKVVLEPDAIHTETAWAKRLPGALTFLFGDLRSNLPK